MLTLTNVTKRFGATQAVDDVSLTIGAGEIVGLVGENGAGKTTLMRIVAGEIAADSGSLSLRPLRLCGEKPSHRRDAENADATVAFVHQHFAIVPELTIAENLALLDRAPFRFLSQRQIERDAETAIERAGIRLPAVTRLAGDLAVGEKSKLELVKAISVDPSLLILDEPTSVLTPQEAAELFEVMRELAARGTAIVFISHKVPEVLAVAERVVVMRRGRIVADESRAAMTAQTIAEAMIGEAVAPPAASIASGPRSAAILEVRGLTGEILRDVSLKVHGREIVAVVGVAGNGQSELAAILRGITRSLSGAIHCATERVGFIPEDRTRDALVAEMTIAENIALGGERWSPGDANRRAASLIDLYGVRAFGPHQRAGSLSGGNQQKVVLARELHRKPTLVVAAEPTRGLDIASTRFVHGELQNAVAAGAGLLLITSDLDEAFALANVVHVIYRGRLSAGLPPAEAAAKLGLLMAGVE